MFSKSIILLSLAAASLASPAPQNTNLSDLAASLTSALGTLPTNLDSASLSSELDAAKSLVVGLTDLPTLPASVISVLATAIPASELTNTDYLCSPTAAGWYKSLPADAKSALESYGSVYASWASDHVSDFGKYSNVPQCTGAAAKGGKGDAGSTTGAVAGATGTSGTGGAAVTSTNSPGAAPQATGAFVGSVAGIVAIGVMVML